MVFVNFNSSEDSYVVNSTVNSNVYEEYLSGFSKKITITPRAENQIFTREDGASDIAIFNVFYEYAFTEAVKHLLCHIGRAEQLYFLNPAAVHTEELFGVIRNVKGVFICAHFGKMP